MAMHLSSFTEKMDALRDKGFSDEEINAILNAPVSPVQPQVQSESQPKVDGLDALDASNIAQFLKAMPSPIPVNETMTNSDRAYAKEWNGHIDSLSFFYGWKSDVLGLCVFFFMGLPMLVNAFFGGSPKEMFFSLPLVMGWMLVCFAALFVVGSYIKEKYILPRMKFFLKKRIN